MTTIKNGINNAATKTIVKHLSARLADSYLLLLKTQNYHWNVTGPNFQSLHTLFQTQYEELFLAVDEIAERIRALGEVAPGSYAQYVKIANVKEDKTAPKDWKAMVKNLLADHERLVRDLRAGIEAAEAGDDVTSADVFTQRLNAHEKTAWMLRVTLG